MHHHFFMRSTGRPSRIYLSTLKKKKIYLFYQNTYLSTFFDYLCLSFAGFILFDFSIYVLIFSMPFENRIDCSFYFYTWVTTLHTISLFCLASVCGLRWKKMIRWNELIRWSELNRMKLNSDLLYVLEVQVIDRGVTGPTRGIVPLLSSSSCVYQHSWK